MTRVDRTQRDKFAKYLEGAQEDQIEASGKDWKLKGELLTLIAGRLREAAPRIPQGMGADTLTSEAAQKAFNQSARALESKGQKLRAAGEALVDVADLVSKARVEHARLQADDPGAPPPPHMPKSYAPGYQPTPTEIQAEADRASAAQTAMRHYVAASDAQEATASKWTARMDERFLESIPPMTAIHGDPDPTEPTNGPGGPGGPGVPGTTGPDGPSRVPATGTSTPMPTDAHEVPVDGTGGTDDPLPDIGRPPHLLPPSPEWPAPITPEGPRSAPSPTLSPTDGPDGPTTDYSGDPQTGTDYDPSDPLGAPAAPTTSGGVGPGGVAAAALGGGAIGGALKGAISGASSLRSSGVKGIGSSSRAGGAGALSRSAAASTAGRSGAAGRTGAAGRAGAAGATGRAGAAGAAGRAGDRAGAGRAGARGAAGAGGGAAGGRGGKRGEREQDERDSMVVDQDWLSDEDGGPGVLR